MKPHFGTMCFRGIAGAPARVKKACSADLQHCYSTIKEQAALITKVSLLSKTNFRKKLKHFIQKIKSRIRDSLTVLEVPPFRINSRGTGDAVSMAADGYTNTGPQRIIGKK